MEAITYKLERFEGPLDLLLTLISKNKVSITDIPISIICDQYIDYIKQADIMNMELASEFILMASELMFIKSKMLLPRTEEEEDPRNTLTDALLRYKQAKEACAKLAPMYAYYSKRIVKDTDEISADKSYVAEQDISSLSTSIRRVIAYNTALEKAVKNNFTPMIHKQVISVELKIISILDKMHKSGSCSLKDLLNDSASLPDFIAMFIGVLELIKIRKILIVENDDVTYDILDDTNTKFILSEETAV